MKNSGLALAYLLLAGLATPAVAVTVETVSVGNPGNAPWRSWGDASYQYGMGKFEVTAAQYTEFLNAVARADAYGLYSASMDVAVDPLGCNIKRTGQPGEYSYSVASDWANRPVNFVSWGDAVRFANWMHNGQPTTGVQNAATTEDGSYLLIGAVSDTALFAVARKPGATWVVPNRDEWYKSAYHKNDGITGNYWLYATGSDIPPSNELLEPVDPGNNATFRIGTDSDTIGAPYWRTEVGAHENSGSPYGTFDQAGNVAEWTEYKGATIVGWRMANFGGSYDGLADLWSIPDWRLPSGEFANIGFRLALVPEPGTLLLFALAGAALRGKRSCKL